jgi:hypothetical protein
VAEKGSKATSSTPLYYDLTLPGTYDRHLQVINHSRFGKKEFKVYKCTYIPWNLSLGGNLLQPVNWYTVKSYSIHATLLCLYLHFTNEQP